MDEEEAAQDTGSTVWMEGDGSQERGRTPSTSGRTMDRRPSRKRRKQAPPSTEEEEEAPTTEIVDSEEELEALERSANSPKRGRGRPPTTGDYVGRATALREMREEEERLALGREEREILDPQSELPVSLREKYRRGVERSMEAMDHAPTPDVAARALEATKSILQVSRTSKGLKGTLQAALRDSAACLEACALQLAGRAQLPEESRADEEVRALREELKSIRERLAASEAQVAELRAGERENKRRAPREKTREKRRVFVESDEDDDANAAEGTDMSPPSPALGPAPQAMEAMEEVVLPPRSEWPPAIRPAIRGRTAVIPEDRFPPMPEAAAGAPLEEPPTKEASTPPANFGELREALRTMMGGMFAEWASRMEEKWGKAARAGPERPKAAPERPRAAQPPTPPVPTPQKGGKGRKGRSGGGGKVPPPVADTAKAQAKVQAKAPPKTGANPPKPPKPPTPSATPPAAAAPAAPVAETWARVVGRREARGNRREAIQGGKPAGGAPPKGGKLPAPRREGGAPPPPPSAKKRPTPAGRRRMPRNAAVTITCPAGTYAEVMREARERVDLASLGIDGLRPKRAMTGALILEVPGQDGAAKAEALAAKLSQALAEKEGVRVARPVKTTEVRVTGLEDSTTRADIAAALSQAGGGSQEEITVGEVRVSPNGLGTAWAKLPATVAKKATAGGKIRVGWALAKVEELAPRPLRCYRCLRAGHTRPQCSEETDRGGLCYRCGEAGHVARACGGEPKCPLCEQTGLPSGHRLGSAACRAPARKGRRGGAVGGRPPPPPPAPAPAKGTKKKGTPGNKPDIPRGRGTVAGEVASPRKQAREEGPFPMDVDVSRSEEGGESQPVALPPTSSAEPMELEAEVSRSADGTREEDAPRERRVPRVVAFESLATRVVVVSPEEAGPGYM